MMNTSTPTLFEASWDSYRDGAFGYDIALVQLAGNLNQYTTNGVPWGVFTLWDDGCSLTLDDPNDESRNCTAACLDKDIAPGLLWDGDDDQTMYNCIIMPLISWFLANGSLHDPNNLTSKYQIPSTPDLWEDHSGYTLINACPIATCKAMNGPDGDCTITSKLIQYDYLDSFPQMTNISFPINSTICDCLDLPINADIGGIGAMGAYIIQVVLVILSGLIFLFHTLRHLWRLRFHKFKRVNTEASWERHQKVIQKELEQTSLRRIWTRHHTPTMKIYKTAVGVFQYPQYKVSLVEFHKAQTFLMMAINAAALISIKKVEILDANSILDVLNNYQFIATMILNGVVPIMLHQLLLEGVGQSSLFMICSSLATVVLSMATYITSVAATINGVIDIEDTKKVEYLPECGGVYSPTSQCVSFQSANRTGFNYAYPLVVFAISIVVCLYLLFQDYRKKTKEEKGQELETPRWVKIIAWILATLGFVLNVIQLMNLIKYIPAGHCASQEDVKSWTANTATAEWSLGQIIAIAIWAPIAAEYMFLVYDGIEEGMKYKVPSPYKIVLDDGKDGDSRGSAELVQTESTKLDDHQRA